MKKASYLLTVIILFLLIFSPTEEAHAQERSEKVKAVFLAKFVNYVTWPDKDEKTFICTYGGNPFGETLNKLAELQKNISVEHLQTGKSIAQCHILYVNASAAIPDTEGKAILTVGEKTDFAKNNGMIEMREDSERIRLIINTDNLRKGNLKAGSRLLDLAELIR